MGSIKYEVWEQLEQIKIAVCDDMEADREKLRMDLCKIWENAKIEMFQTGNSVLQEIRKGNLFQIVFLDIYLEDRDGIEIGKAIHNDFPMIDLVFVTSSREFGPEAFEINALHYLVKPYKFESLLDIKGRYEQKKARKAVIRAGRGQQEEEIPYQMISYVESVHNYLLFHLITGAELKIRGSLQEIMDRLDDRFLRINRGIVVNMEAIEKMNTDSCEIGGMTFMLSRKQRAENRRRYNDFLFEEAVKLSGGAEKND